MTLSKVEYTARYAIQSFHFFRKPKHCAIDNALVGTEIVLLLKERIATIIVLNDVFMIIFNLILTERFFF